MANSLEVQLYAGPTPVMFRQPIIFQDGRNVTPVVWVADHEFVASHVGLWAEGEELVRIGIGNKRVRAQDWLTLAEGALTLG